MAYDHKGIKEKLDKFQVVQDPATRVKDNLISLFLRENPPADEVKVVGGTLRQSAKHPSFWEATVQTALYYPRTGVKTHNSRVFFYVDSRHNIINKKVNFRTV